LILTGPAIAKAVAEGELVIEPFSAGHVNPNSYNVHLGDVLLVPRDNAEVTDRVLIPPTGVVLAPKRLYLASTVERFGGRRHVTCLISRSSMGRLGLFAQLNADMGNTGAVHAWTLELFAVQPLRIFRGMRIAQIMFWRTRGELRAYPGAYANFNEPHECRYAVTELSPRVPGP
jgi:dCTP deaminase